MGRWRSSVIRIEELSVHFREKGDPEGPPVLLLHGSFASGRWWEPVMDLLPDSLYVIAPDLRGCGQSSKLNWGYDIPTLAEDMQQFTSALGLRDIDLVGHSTGGAIAIEFALRHMETLHTLTLVDSVPIQGMTSPPEMIDLLEQMKTGTPEALSLLSRALRLLMPSLMADLRGSDVPATDPSASSFFGRLVDDAAAMAPAAYTEMARALAAWNRLAEAERLTLPTLLIWGDQDVVVDREATTRTLLAIPGANQMEVLRGVGHSPMIEAPLAFAERLVDFITSPTVTPPAP